MSVCIIEAYMMKRDTVCSEEISREIRVNKNSCRACVQTPEGHIEPPTKPAQGNMEQSYWGYSNI